MTYAKQFLDIVKETLPEGAVIQSEDLCLKQESTGGMMFFSYCDKNNPEISSIMNVSQKYCKKFESDPAILDGYLRKTAENARKMYFNKLKALRG